MHNNLFLPRFSSLGRTRSAQTVGEGGFRIHLTPLSTLKAVHDAKVQLCWRLGQHREQASPQSHLTLLPTGTGDALLWHPLSQEPNFLTLGR